LQGTQGRIGQTGSQGTQGLQGTQGAAGNLTGVNANAPAVGSTPVSYDSQLLSGAASVARYGINKELYLPGGDGTRSGLNSLPVQCDNFIFLQAEADLSIVGGGITLQKVYIPCYWTI
jgi:hypothetical protein